jgi:hypothetical protein
MKGEDTIVISSDSSSLNSTFEDIEIDLGSCGHDDIVISNYDDAGTITIDPSIYSVSGSMGSVAWTQDYSNTITTGYPSVNIDTNGISVKEGGDIKIGGKSLSDAIDKIEERLGILNPNPELEERWEKLKELRQQYIEMEKDLLEKEKIMKILKEK